MSTPLTREDLDDQLASLESGVRGFESLFRALSATMRHDLLKAQRTPVVDAKPAPVAAPTAVAVAPEATPPQPAVPAVAPPAKVEVQETSAASADAIPPAFLAALAGGIEATVGPAAKGVVFSGGRKLGHSLAAEQGTTVDPAEIVKRVTAMIDTESFTWIFDGNGFQPTVSEKTLSFDRCMITPLLNACGHEHGGALCHMVGGILTGMVEQLAGAKVRPKTGRDASSPCLEAIELAS